MLQGIRNAVGRLFGGQNAGQVKAAHAERQVALANQLLARIQARYEAAQTTDEFKNYWASADRYDADSANSKEVRHTLISRSRYEIANNSYFDGIAQTVVNDLIGTGPALHMNSGSPGFNQMVETTWTQWAQAVDLRRKLWTMGHAKHVDGEAFGVLRRNPRVRHPVSLDVVLYEAEQCQTPWIPYTEPNYIDGIKFDEFGNPLWYDFLNQHPGTARGALLNVKPEQVPAELVLHWFRQRRPGQHRGVPEMVSSLNAGAAARRWREATLSAAERAALLTLMMETPMSPDEADAVAPFSTMDIEKGMMSFLPMGWKPFQAEGKFPTATHEQFHKTLINEMGRAVNMPRNKAACDSSDYNYASGRLDHGTYYDSLDVQRRDCDERVLDPLFAVWFDLAVLRFGWLGGNPDAIGPIARSHSWDWPKHRVADVEAEANANETKLTSGQVGLHRLYSDAGLDLEDEIPAMAQTFGVDESEVRKRLFDIVLPAASPAPASTEKPQPKAVDQAVANFFRRNGVPKVNGNGAHHG